jgi:hypothetical protein
MGKGNRLPGDESPESQPDSRSLIVLDARVSRSNGQCRYISNGLS